MSRANRKNTFSAIFGNRDILKALVYTVVLLFIFRLGCAIPTPGTNAKVLTQIMSNNSVLAMMNMFGGGSLSNFSIFALGVSPFISASIIVQLLSMDVVPALTEMTKTGEKGRRKLNRITRILGLVLAAIQAFALTYGFDRQYGLLVTSNWKYYGYVTAVLVGGYSIAVWFADKITRHGIANGMSMMIFTGIVANIPSIFVSTFSSLVSGKTGNDLYIGTAWFVAFCLVYLLIIVAVIFMETSYRKIRVYYSNQSMSGMTNDSSFIPVKVNTASVIPVIFAQSLVNVVLMITSFASKSAYTKISGILSLTTVPGLCIYAFLVIFFTFAYADMELNPEEMASQLSKSGGYIRNIRPGKDTQTYLSKTIARVTVAGAAGLVVLAVLPYILSMVTDLSSASAIGGTGMIIVVGVALEAVNSLKAIAAPSRKPNFL